MIGILGYIFICTTAIFIYSTINLMRKVEHLEEVISEQDSEWLDLKSKIRQTILDMRKIDSRQAFEKDDEVGDIFSSLKEMVDNLDIKEIEKTNEA